MSEIRTPSAVDQIANQYVEDSLILSPIASTSMGVPGLDTQLDDFSPEGLEKAANLDRSVLTELAKVHESTELDAVDRVTIAAMQERLELAAESHTQLIPHSALNNIASPIQGVRGVFDLMPQETAADWEVIAERLEKIPSALAGYVESLKYAAEKGDMASKRQFEIGKQQSDNLAAADGFFAQMPAKAQKLAGLNQVQIALLEKAAQLAQKAYGTLSEQLEGLQASAPLDDAVGPEKYALLSRNFLGDEIDPREAYEFGIQELESLIAEQKELAKRINAEYSNGGGDSIEAAMASLNSDPRLVLHGTDALREWMQRLSDQAIKDLHGTHFDIPEPLHRLECMIAETGEGGIYYTGPSEDLSRPGRMWWDTPSGVDTFQTWRETTTVYHEGVPGHHLQVGIQTMQSKKLNRWRSQGVWISGHGEGWALYAERLMEELGYLRTDAEKLGMLAEQRMRAGRVVLDIGLHNRFEMPPAYGGGSWDYEKAWGFVKQHWSMAEPIARFELHRYLGWAGQAPSYKLGQKVWEELRSDAQKRGEDVKDFHRRALELGALPFNVLRKALNAEI